MGVGGICSAEAIAPSGCFVGERRLQGFITGWCNLIGITDVTAIAIATGIVGGGLLLFAAVITLAVAGAVVGWIVGQG